MPSQNRFQPDLLLVTEDRNVAGGFSRNNSVKAKTIVVRSISDCHSILARDPRFDAVVVDCRLGSSADDLLGWVEGNHQPVAAVRLSPAGDDRTGRPDIALKADDPLVDRVYTAVRRELAFELVIAVPENGDLRTAATDAFAAQDDSSVLQTTVLSETKWHLKDLEERKDQSEIAIESLYDKYLSQREDRKVCAALSITGKAENDFVFAAGRRHDAPSWRLPSGALSACVSGYPDEAVLLYLAARAGLTLGAGLPFHRAVSDCPLDFCFDLLDFARGMMSGKLCAACEATRDAMLREGRCGLTRLQIDALLDLSSRAAEFCRQKSGGVVVPNADISEKTSAAEMISPLEEEVSKNLSRMARAAKEHFSEYSTARRVLGNDSSFLLAARHYNSDSPTIPGARGFARRSNIDLPAEYLGGGYFLAHRGVGVAIDPGYNFLRILYDVKPFGSETTTSGPHRGYTTEDIDVVIVTHNHLDHHADLETILRTRRGRKLTLCCNRELMQEYELENRTKHTQLELVECNSDDESAVISLGRHIDKRMAIRRLPTLHWQHTYFRQLGGSAGDRLKTHLNGFGLTITLHEDPNVANSTSGDQRLRTLLITSDTLFPIVTEEAGQASAGILKASFDSYVAPKAWSRLLMRRSDWDNETCGQLVDAYVDFLDRYAEVEPDVACVHIGSLEGDKPNAWRISAEAPTLRYGGHHLGLMGTWRLLDAMKRKPKLVLLTEFGEELVGFRTHLCDGLDHLLGKASSHVPKILPTDVGLCLDLSTGNIRCSRCDGWHHFQEIVAAERGSDFVEYVPAAVAESDNNTCQWRGVSDSTAAGS